MRRRQTLHRAVGAAGSCSPWSVPAARKGSAQSWTAPNPPRPYAPPTCPPSLDAGEEGDQDAPGGSLDQSFPTAFNLLQAGRPLRHEDRAVRGPSEAERLSTPSCRLPGYRRHDPPEAPGGLGRWLCGGGEASTGQ